MRRLYLLIITFVVAISSMAEPMDRQQARQQSQTRKTSKSTSVRSKKPATQKGKGKASKSSASKPSAPKASKAQTVTGGGMFEGSLLYRSEEYHSSVVRKFSYGRAYNGARTTIVTVKGSAVHILDEPMHLHTIVNLSDNTVYMYSDLTNKGIKGTTKNLEAFINTYDPNYQIGDQQKVSTLKMTDEKATLDNQKCGIYKGEVTAGDENRLDVEMWMWDQFKVNKAYNYMLFGIPAPGIVRKGIYSQIVSVPLLGKMKSMVALELMAFSRYSVNSSEMLPPPSVSIENYKDVKQLTRLYKDNRKQLKKLKLNPESKSKKEMMRNIRDRWDFADDWLKKPVSTANNALAWRTLGNSLLELVTTISSIGTDQSSASNTAMDTGIDDMMADDSSDSSIDPKAKKEKDRKNKERREENKKKLKQGEFASRTMRSSTRTYSNYVDMINRIKNGVDYRGESFETKKREVKNCQEQMKQIRERYESGSGQKMPGANEQLERWNPSHSDLMEKCSGCGGDGKCGNCYRRGNGKCSSCGGTGDISKNRKERLSCPNCQFPGNTYCKTCDGSGKCQTCKGKKEF